MDHLGNSDAATGTVTADRMTASVRGVEGAKPAAGSGDMGMSLGGPAELTKVTADGRVVVRTSELDVEAAEFELDVPTQVGAVRSEPGRLVTNGMSQYSRKERNANAGLVVDINPERDFPGHPLAGIALQRHWEEQAFIAGGSDYTAPGQRLGDFLAARPSTALGEVVPSYKPGVRPTDLSTCLPDFAIVAMREALPVFGRQIPGFDDPDAVMTGVETRTSSPIRITRGQNFQSLNTAGLYPAGEGAGYAGGILSAAIDGIKVAEAVGLAMVG